MDQLGRPRDVPAVGGGEHDLECGSIASMVSDEVLDRPHPGGEAEAPENDDGVAGTDPEERRLALVGDRGLDPACAGDDRQLVVLADDPVERLAAGASRSVSTLLSSVCPRWAASSAMPASPLSSPCATFVLATNVPLPCCLSINPS